MTFSGAKDPEAALLLAEDGRNDLEQVRPAGWQQQRRRADAKNLALVHRREARIGASRRHAQAVQGELKTIVPD